MTSLGLRYRTRSYVRWITRIVPRHVWTKYYRDGQWRVAMWREWLGHQYDYIEFPTHQE